MEQIRNISISTDDAHPLLADVFFMDDGKPKPMVIFSHGFKGFKDWGTFNMIAEQFAREGFIFIKFNFSCNGVSLDNPIEFTDLDAFSKNNFSRELDDLEQVISWSLSNALIPESERAEEEICLLGHSRGGAISIIKASEDERVKKLVTWAAVGDLGEKWNAAMRKEWKAKGVMQIENSRTGQQMPLKYQLIEDLENNKERLDVIAAASRISVPFMAVHGTEDESVPFEHAIAMKRVNKQVKLNLIPSAGHTFGSYHPYHEKRLPIDTALVVKDGLQFFLES
ncbi:MAG: prolyl oligopeptidase family serine peptidase [Bacteroidia bacterium]